MINFLYSFYMTYVLYCILASTCVINQQKGRVIKVETHRKDEGLILKSSHKGRQISQETWDYLCQEKENEKNHTHKTIHTCEWLWETDGDLSAGVLSGDQDVSGLLDQTIQPWGTKSLSSSKTSTMALKGNSNQDTLINAVKPPWKHKS